MLNSGCYEPAYLSFDMNLNLSYSQLIAKLTALPMKEMAPDVWFSLLLDLLIPELNLDSGLVLNSDQPANHPSILACAGIQKNQCQDLLTALGMDVIDHVWEEKNTNKRQFTFVNLPNAPKSVAKGDETWYLAFPIQLDEIKGAILIFAPSDEINDYQQDLENLARFLGLLVNNWWIARALKNSEAKISDQRKSFSVLLSIAESIGEAPSVQKIMSFALAPVQDVTGFDTVAMRIYNRDDNCFLLKAQIGMSPEMVEKLRCVPGEDSHLVQLTDNMRPIIRTELKPSSLKMGFQTLIHVPIIGNERLLGLIDLASRETHQTNDDELRWLMIVGRNIGTLIHQVSLTERIRDLAVVKERSLIAQEIHDGVAQLISMIHVWTVSAKLSYESREYQKMQSAIDKIDRISNDAYSILREEMLGLRDTIDSDEKIIPVIEKVLERYTKRWGIKTHLLVEIDDEVEMSLPLSPEDKIQLLRIIQESLINVRQHAKASAIDVRFKETGELILISIEDDGSGFDPSDIPLDSLGLQIVHERAQSIDGAVEIESIPGQGTMVRIEIPKKGL